MNIKNKNPILKILVSSLIIILLGATIIVFVILPTVKYIKNLKIDIQKIEQDSEDQYQKIKLLKKSIAELETVKENSKKLEQGMINKDDTIKLIQELEDLAIEKKVIQNLNIQEGPENSFVFSFSVRGTFYDTLQYLHSLEQLPFYVIINSVNWSKVDDQNVVLSFNASIFTK